MKSKENYSSDSKPKLQHHHQSQCNWVAVVPGFKLSTAAERDQQTISMCGGGVPKWHNEPRSLCHVHVYLSSTHRYCTSQGSGELDLMFSGRGRYIWPRLLSSTVIHSSLTNGLKRCLFVWYPHLVNNTAVDLWFVFPCCCTKILKKYRNRVFSRGDMASLRCLQNKTPLPSRSLHDPIVWNC